LEVRRSGGLFGPRVERLYIGGRDMTSLLDGLAEQVDAVRAVLAAVSADEPVRGALCFVGTELPWFGSSSIAGIPLVGRRGLEKLPKQPGDLAPDDRVAVAAYLEGRFIPATTGRPSQPRVDPAEVAQGRGIRGSLRLDLLAEQGAPVDAHGSLLCQDPAARAVLGSAVAGPGCDITTTWDQRRSLRPPSDVPNSSPSQSRTWLRASWPRFSGPSTWSSSRGHQPSK
jgi:hypothetical protein